MKISVDELALKTQEIKAGMRIFLSGTIYTARDQAHKRIIDLLDKKEKTPFELKNSCIYYCGPLPARPPAKIGACGPTTSLRMDVFTPRLILEGVKIFIGKGPRSAAVCNAISQRQAVYLVATGGTAALLYKTITDAQIIAFEDLGAEAVYKLQVKDMPLIAAVDAYGNNIFKRG
ncbi:MAG: FumA C-terminus/TtdB family hydratase beta subunit [Elusimicrobiota bacterium]|jgi:fumarate hydratase subunit beta|nr:FumA C-terminus/TtdB family hydratase beta subunit [Elusimicrobiota bacterium]